MLDNKSNHPDGSENSSNVVNKEMDNDLTKPVKTPIESSYQRHEWGYRSTRLTHKNDEKPKRNYNYIFAGVGVFSILVLFLVLFFMGVFRTKTNAEKLFQAILKTSELTRYEKFMEVKANESKVSDSIVNFNLFYSILSQMGMKVNSKVDFKNSKSETNYIVSINDIDFLDFFVQEDKRDYLIEAPKLFKERLFLSRQGLYQLLDDYDSSEQLQLEANIESFSIENLENFRKNMIPAFNPLKLKSFKRLNKQKYMERILEYYNQKLSVEKGTQSYTVNGQEREFHGDIYTLKETAGESYEFYHTLLMDMVKDENFKPFLEEYLDTIIASSEKHKDIVLYNSLARFDAYTPLKANWDEEVKSHLVYWKQLVLDEIDQFAKEVVEPHYADQTAKTVKLLKDSDVYYESVFVVDDIVNYFDLEFSVDVKSIVSGSKQISLLEPNYQTPVELIKLKIITAITATGNDVVFKEMDKSDVLDYANATKEDIKILSDEIKSNAINILNESKIF